MEGIPLPLVALGIILVVIVLAVVASRSSSPVITSSYAPAATGLLKAPAPAPVATQAPLRVPATAPAPAPASAPASVIAVPTPISSTTASAIAAALGSTTQAAMAITGAAGSLANNVAPAVAPAPATSGFQSGPSSYAEAFQGTATAPTPAGPPPPLSQADADSLIQAGELVNSVLDGTLQVPATTIAEVQSILKAASPPVNVPDSEVNKYIRLVILQQMTPPPDMANDMKKMLTAIPPPSGKVLALPNDSGPPDTLSASDLQSVKTLSYTWSADETTVIEYITQNASTPANPNRLISLMLKIIIFLSGLTPGGVSMVRQ